jgi:hypothetical protein
MIKNCFEKTLICKCRASHCKSDESTDRCIENWFPGMLPKDVQMLAKVSEKANADISSQMSRDLIWA